MVEELAELLGRLDDEVGSFEGGVGRELPEQVVVAIHVGRLRAVPGKSTGGTRDRVPSARAGTSSGGVRRSTRRPGGPARGCLRRLFELVERRVVGQVQQDHVVEVPAVGDVVPADEADAELLLVVLHLLREDRAHEELEERVAAAADGEVGREHGHVVAVLLGDDPGQLAPSRPAIVARGPRRATRRRWRACAAPAAVGGPAVCGSPAASSGEPGRRPCGTIRRQHER